MRFLICEPLNDSVVSADRSFENGKLRTDLFWKEKNASVRTGLSIVMQLDEYLRWQLDEVSP